MEDMIKLEEVKELLKGYVADDMNEYNSNIGRCIEDINFYDKFPEDLVESRTDWDDLKEMLNSAHRAVLDLLYIIEQMKGNK